MRKMTLTLQKNTTTSEFADLLIEIQTEDIIGNWPFVFAFDYIL